MSNNWYGGQDGIFYENNVSSWSCPKAKFSCPRVEVVQDF